MHQSEDVRAIEFFLISPGAVKLALKEYTMFE